MSELDAYRTLRKFFLDHDDEYDYLVLCPDDLIVTDFCFRMLLSNVEDHGFPVHAGVCNVSWQERDLFSPCMKLPDEENGYQWMTRDALRTADTLLKVKFDALAMCFIRRDVVEKIKLEGDELGGRMDVQFAKDCDSFDIPMYVDTRAVMLHLKNRKGDGTLENCGIGIYPPAKVFQAAKS